MVEMTGVSKHFKHQTVFQDVAMALEEGRIYGIVGRNGSGKSVLLKMICGLMLPTAGTVTVAGKVLQNGDFAEDVGILLDNTGFLPRLSAFDNLKSIAVIRSVVTDERIRDCINQVGLDADSKKPVGKYSLGMKQRLSIAQAMMEQPKLLLLDEPMNALDEDGVKDMRALLKAYQKEQDATILIVSHNREDIEELCDEVYVIRDRKVCRQNSDFDIIVDA